MVTILSWLLFSLPTALSWRAPWLSFALNLLAWAGLAVFLRFVVYHLLHRLARRSQTDLDDVVTEASRLPLLTVFALAGAYHSLERLGPRAAAITGVTEQYNVNSHSIIDVPNSQLAYERRVNVTRPIDLRPMRAAGPPERCWIGTRLDWKGTDRCRRSLSPTACATPSTTSWRAAPWPSSAGWRRSPLPWCWWPPPLSL